MQEEENLQFCKKLEIKRISLEKEALQFCKDNEEHPRIYELPPEEGRKKFEEVQSSPVVKLEVDFQDMELQAGEWGKINVRFIRPKNKENQVLPVIYYIHGAGWEFGSAKTHDKLVRELAVRTNSVVVFPEYYLSPEAKYPTAIEQNYFILQELKNMAEEQKLDLSNLTVSGDSVGGNMAIVMTLLTKEREGIKIRKQLLFYPVTDAMFFTDSYNQFYEHYFLTRTAMKKYWSQYLEYESNKEQITASPLKASLEQLKGLPTALIITGEADVLRDEGEKYAKHLRDAGVDVTQVRFQGIIHDFVMLNTLDNTNAARAAMDLAVTWWQRK